MGPEDAATAVEWIRPKVVIPMHWGAFPVLVQDPCDFVGPGAGDRRLDQPVVLRPGETYDL